jgi:hypothetical protein
MKRIIFIFLLGLVFFISINSYAAGVIRKSDMKLWPVNCDPINYIGNPDYIIIDETYLNAHPSPAPILQKYRKLSGDDLFVEEMTTQEKAAVDQAIADVLAQNLLDAKDITKAVSKIIKAAFLVCAEELGMTPAEFKTAVETKYDEL